jgi:hypothetical protein
MKKTVLFTLMFALGPVFLAPAPAFANNPPAGNSMLYEMLMFLVLIALTAAGGGYAVLSKKKPGRRWTGWVGYSLLAVAAILFSAMQEGIMFLVVLIVAIYGILRGAELIKWGIQARPNKQRPEYLSEAAPWRLIAAGAVLIVLMAALAAAATISHSTHSPYRLRGYTSALNSDARNAYTYLKVYEADNPRATGIVSCADLQKVGFTLSFSNICSSDVMLRSGKVISGSIRITLKPGRTTVELTKPEAVITYKGELSEARP